MTDNQIIAIIVSILNNGFTSRSMTVDVKQRYQPTSQGAPSTPVVYLHKLSPTRYGFPGERSTYNKSDRDFDTSRNQYQLPSFQVSGLSQQDPADVNSVTASDLVETAAEILQTPETVSVLQESNIGIERIRDIRILYFLNDKKRYEQDPSFDFTLSFLRSSVVKTPRVSRHRATINRA